MMGRMALRSCQKCKIGCLYEEIDDTGDATCSSCGSTFIEFFSVRKDRVLTPFSRRIELEVLQEMRLREENPSVRRAISLRNRGLSFETIGSIMNVTPDTAKKWVTS